MLRTRLTAVVGAVALSSSVAVVAQPPPAEAHPGVILLGLAELAQGWASHGGDSDGSDGSDGHHRRDWGYGRDR